MTNKPYVVVVGTDYSKPAERALSLGYEQARRATPAELHVVHVSFALAKDSSASLGPLFGGGGPLTMLTLEEQRAQLVAHLDATLALRSDFRDGNLRVIAHVVLGTPAFALAQLATQLEADLVVVGSHGRQGVARWLLGSVAEALLRQATCPVLVLPPEPHQLAVPAIEPPCPRCVEVRSTSASHELWCAQHREHHGRRHTYYQSDRVGADTNFPLVVR